MALLDDGMSCINRYLISDATFDIGSVVPNVDCCVTWECGGKDRRRDPVEQTSRS